MRIPTSEIKINILGFLAMPKKQMSLLPSVHFSFSSSILYIFFAYILIVTSESEAEIHLRTGASKIVDSSTEISQILWGITDKVAKKNIYVTPIS